MAAKYSSSSNVYPAALLQQQRALVQGRPSTKEPAAEIQPQDEQHGPKQGAVVCHWHQRRCIPHVAVRCQFVQAVWRFALAEHHGEAFH